jgi:hypothetical protein
MESTLMIVRAPRSWFTAVLLTLLCALPAPASAGELAFGPRVGYTHDGDRDLDQLHLGGHVVLQNLTTNLHLVTSLEVGTGDGTLVALNGDLVYEFTEMASGGWGYYAGGGPMLSRYKRNRHKSDDFALNLVVGATHQIRQDRTLFGEVRLGLEDAPALKLTLGLTFF